MIGIIIGGPTGVGKTSLSIKLAKILDAVIINCDSMQIYKHMDIGTAKITEKEKEGVEHYMFDIVEPIDRYNVGDYYRDVNSLLKKFEKDNRNVILVGGTGLYIKSLISGVDYSDFKSDDIFRTFAQTIQTTAPINVGIGINTI